MRRERVRANGLWFEALVAGEGAPLALLLHGFPDDARSWTPVLEGLAAAGWTAVAPWLRGYPPSDPAPRGDYGLPALARDVTALIAALGRERALVIGHDWGAVAAYAAAQHAPARCSRLVALSVPPVPVLLRALLRPDQARRSAYMAAFQLPGAAARLRADLEGAVRRLWTAWSPDWRPPPGRVEEVARTLAAPGALEAALAYYRALGPRGWTRPRALAASARLLRRPIAVPARLLVGERDGCIAPSAFAGAEAAFSAAVELEVVPGAGHFLPLEAPELVLAAALG